MSAKPHHPSPATIGAYIADVAKILRDETPHDSRKTHCRCIECTAARLAQIGWPAATTGDGRGGNPELTRVEAAATTTQPYAGIDHELAQALRVLWRSARIVEDKIHKIRRHESDSEKVGGLGNCEICERFCNPRRNPNDRLRGSWCPPCDTAWRRWITTNPDGLRPDFVRHRRAALPQTA